MHNYTYTRLYDFNGVIIFQLPNMRIVEFIFIDF